MNRLSKILIEEGIQTKHPRTASKGFFKDLSRFLGSGSDPRDLIRSFSNALKKTSWSSSHEILEDSSGEFEFTYYYERKDGNGWDSPEYVTDEGTTDEEVVYASLFRVTYTAEVPLSFLFDSSVGIRREPGINNFLKGLNKRDLQDLTDLVQASMLRSGVAGPEALVRKVFEDTLEGQYIKIKVESLELEAQDPQLKVELGGSTMNFKLDFEVEVVDPDFSGEVKAPREY